VTQLLERCPKLSAVPKCPNPVDAVNNVTGDLPNLRELELNASESDSDSWVAALSKCPGVRMLKLVGFRSVLMSQVFAMCENVTHLDVQSVKGEDFSCFSVLPKLTELSISEHSQSAQVFSSLGAALSQTASLTSLSITPIFGGSLRYISLPSVTHLTVVPSSPFNDYLPLQGACDVSGFPNLEFLKVRGVFVTDGNLNKLRVLFSSEVTDSDCEMLVSKCPHLRDLNLSGFMFITEAGVSHVLRLTLLESLDIQETSVSNMMWRLFEGTAPSLLKVTLPQDQGHQVAHLTRLRPNLTISI